MFGHAAPFFFSVDIEGDVENCEFACLSAESCPDASFVAAAFDVVMSERDWRAFRGRERLYEIVEVPYYSIEDGSEAGMGIMCTSSTDEQYIARWGRYDYETKISICGGVVTQIWGWPRESKLRPCRVYLRHCVLSAQKAPLRCVLQSFLDDTFLVDRVSTVRTYLERHPYVMDAVPPPELNGRYSG